MICPYLKSLKSRLFWPYFWVVVCSAEWFGTAFSGFASIFVPRIGILVCFLFCGMVWNVFPRVCFLFLFQGTEFRVVFSSAEEFRTDFWEFASIFVPWNGNPWCFLFRRRVQNGIPWVSVLRNSRNSAGNNHLFRLFRLPRNYFFVRNSQPQFWSLDHPITFLLCSPCRPISVCMRDTFLIPYF